MKRIMTNKYHKIPLYEYDNIIKRKENGELIRDISASYGVIDRTIYHIIHKHNKIQKSITSQLKEDK